MLPKPSTVYQSKANPRLSVLVDRIEDCNPVWIITAREIDDGPDEELSFTDEEWSELTVVLQLEEVGRA